MAKRKPFIYILLFVALALFSCSADVDMEGVYGEGFIGTWVEIEYRGDTLVMDRAAELAEDAYGFIIKGDGTFIERKNSGWCGTPPIHYDNFEGSWYQPADSLLNIIVDFWGGSMSYQIRILEVSASELAIQYYFEDAMITDSGF